MRGTTPVEVVKWLPHDGRIRRAPDGTLAVHCVECLERAVVNVNAEVPAAQVSVVNVDEELQDIRGSIERTAANIRAEMRRK